MPRRSYCRETTAKPADRGPTEHRVFEWVLRDICRGYWVVDCVPNRHKKARDAITFLTEGIRKPRMRNAPRPCRFRPIGRNITRAGNIYTPFSKSPNFSVRHKELLLFKYVPGYAELSKFLFIVVRVLLSSTCYPRRNTFADYLQER